MQGPQQTVLLTYILYIGALVGWWLLYAGTTADSTAYLYTVYRSLLAGGCCMQGPQQTVLLTYILYIGALVGRWLLYAGTTADSCCCLCIGVCVRRWSIQTDLFC